MTGYLSDPPQHMSFYPSLPVPLGLPVETTPAHPCPYLPERVEMSRGFRCRTLPGWAYQALMDAGFRRSGDVFYQMTCPGCRGCVPIRVPVDRFRPSRSQRRILGRNRDLSFEIGRPAYSEEKNRLYARYLEARHDGMMTGSQGEFERFLCRSPTDTVEVCYRDPAGRLVGVGICDLTATALSTVYFYFDPELARRGLGIYSTLLEIRVARSLGLEHYYMGYWVEGSPKMHYKSAFRPCEILGTDGTWRPLERVAVDPSSAPCAG